MTNRKGIFCLEGDWDTDLRRTMTMQPVLDLLSKSHTPGIPSIRRGIGTATELEHYLGKWTQQRYADFPVLYLGFHGCPGMLSVGGSPAEQLDLDWLEERLAGACARRIVHFGSCGTMAMHGRRLARFLKRTQALAMCGYCADVDWMLSAAFEVVLMSALQHHDFTPRGMRGALAQVKHEASGLTRLLKFRLVTATAF